MNDETVLLVGLVALLLLLNSKERETIIPPNEPLKVPGFADWLRRASPYPD